MATTVAQHPLTAFTSPTNGTSPIDADEVRNNDSAIRTAYNAHDADTGIHVQSSVFGSRPAAGDSGRKWITVDQLSAPTMVRSWYDDGTNWYEHNYFGSPLTVASTITVSSTAALNGAITTTYATSNGKWMQGPAANTGTPTRTYSDLHGIVVQYDSGDTTSSVLCNARWDVSDAQWEYTNANGSATLLQLGDSGRVTLYVAGTGASAGDPVSWTSAWQVLSAGGTMGVRTSASSTANLTVAASTTSVAPFRIPHGSAPTSPVNGDMWTTTAGLFVRINGVTVGPLS